MSDFADIIGNNYSIKPLKPLGKRIRNRWLIPENREPSVDLVVTGDGMKYKLLRGAAMGNRRISNILETQEVVGSLDFVPKILLATPTQILVEFIDGGFPNFSDRHFAVNFGKHLAQLHNLNIGKMDSMAYLNKIESDLHYLTSQNILSQDIKSSIFEKICALIPEELRTSVIYANMHNPRNYVVNHKSELYFIDLGSFQEDRVTDDVLFGYRLFKALDVNTFWESYFKSGGTRYIYDNQKFLKLSQHIKKAAKHLRSYHSNPFYDLWQKRLSHKRFHWMMNELIAEIDTF